MFFDDVVSTDLKARIFGDFRNRFMAARTLNLWTNSLSLIKASIRA